MSSFTGTTGNDVFTGGTANDTAFGKAGADRLSGDDGSDLLVGGSGADTLDGGAGDDTLFSGESPPPYYNDAYVLPVLDTGSEVDNLKGGDGSDRLFAGYGDNVDGGSNGWFGDYLFISFMGAPKGVSFDGGLATQTIGGGVIKNIENISYVQGSQFGDNLNVRASMNGYSDFTAVHGMGGNDTLTAGYYTGTLFGDAGDDVVDGRPSQYLDLVDGGDGNDTLYTNSNTFASADGGAGDDTIYAHGQTHGGAGNDVIFMQYSYYPGYVYGDAGNDKVTAADSGNIIIGGAGADTLTGGNGADTLFSGDLNTTVYPVAPIDDAGLEHDVLAGGNGDDALAIGYGDDVDGGAGFDTLRLSLAGRTAGIDFDTSGIVSGQPFTLGGGVIKNIEKLLSVRGSEFADTLRLQTQASQLTVDAGGGNDVIISQGSSVSVMGGAGDDRFVSGIAADTFTGGAGFDTVDYSGFKAGVSVNLATGVGAGGDTLLQVEGVIGTGFNDVLTGDANANRLDGGAGSDRLTGGGGADTMAGGLGDDAYYVDDPLDQVLEKPGEGVDKVISTVSFQLGANVENLTLTGAAAVNGDGNELANTLQGNTGANVLNGFGGADFLYGDLGDDTLAGGLGDDTLQGGPGADILTGGDGADTFLFQAAGPGNLDQLTDFTHGVDRLAVKASVYGLPVGTLAASALVLGPTALHAHAEFVYDATTRMLSWDPDGTGVAKAVALAHFTTAVTLTASDFLVI